MRSAFKISVGKHEGERLLTRPRCRLEDNIRMEWEGVDWIHLAQIRD
jgi:hypothetical protein